MWVDIKIAFVWESSFIKVLSCLICKGSKPEFGSSKIKFAGLWINPWAKETLCCCPLESVFIFFVSNDSKSNFLTKNFMLCKVSSFERLWFSAA